MPDTSAAPSRVITAAEAIREATILALEHDERVFVMGEGATDPKGIFGTTKGLMERFGPRVVEMPISENGWTGVAIGSALMGQRPLLIHQRVEFCILALEQLINNAAKLHYVTGGEHRVPMVIRLVVGRGWGQGPAHSQSLEGLFAQVPGLKVVMPSSAADAKGLLLGAIEDDNPVIFIEHRWVHYASGTVEPGYTPYPLDGPRTMLPGDDVTVVANSYMALEALQAAQALGEIGCGVDLLDLRVVRPLNLDPIVESVRRTGHLVTIDTGHRAFGIGAEIVAETTSRAFADLKQPPLRIGLPDRPTPSSRALAQTHYPRSADIAQAIGGLLNLDVTNIQAVTNSLMRNRDDLPFDVPHPSFAGPF